MRSTNALLVLLGLALRSVGCVPSPHTRPRLGALREFALPADCGRACGPGGITHGPDGYLWFTELQGNKIGRITPSGSITEFPLPSRGSNALEITSGPDGNLWFTEEAGNKIGRITPAGRMVEVTLPTRCPGTPSGCSPVGITSGPDGDLWFTEEAGNKIGRITPAGRMVEFALPTDCASAPFGCGPGGIALGPDGNLWFTEEAGGKIGRITPAGRIAEFTLPPVASTAFRVLLRSPAVPMVSSGLLQTGTRSGRLRPSEGAIFRIPAYRDSRVAGRSAALASLHGPSVIHAG